MFDFSCEWCIILCQVKFKFFTSCCNQYIFRINLSCTFLTLYVICFLAFNKPRFHQQLGISPKICCNSPYKFDFGVSNLVNYPAHLSHVKLDIKKSSLNMAIASVIFFNSSFQVVCSSNSSEVTVSELPEI